MCGIAGAVNWGDRDSLLAMVAVQAHRGPDDQGIWETCAQDGTRIGLGSCRLAIQDLSAAGKMPMSNEDGTVWITYNGEVYNFPELREELVRKGHRFRSAADTEVIVHLYEEHGPECVKRLNGMFAFAICDTRLDQPWSTGAPRLFLARDHFGVKPLYYVQQGRRFAFASEAKAFLRLPGFQPELDLEALDSYLTLLWVPDPLTALRGVLKLPPGHYAVLDRDRFEVRQYWDLTFPDSSARREPASLPDLIEETRARLRKAVRSQLISDVPVGAFLSSGLDSAVIVALMAEATSEPVHTYTITFPEQHRIGEHTLDDPRVAARVAAALGCNHHEIVVEPDVVTLLPQLVWQLDEPIADPAIVMSFLVCREASRDVTVLLSGVGGDEVFAGYRKYAAQSWSRAYRRLPPILRQTVLEPFVLGLPVFRGTPLKGFVRLAKKMVRSAALPPEQAFLMNSTYQDAAQRSALYTPDLNAILAAHDPWQQHLAHFARVEHAGMLDRMLYVDSKTFMVSLNLTYNDKMSMASSVETRVPFLDTDLVTFVATRVPPDLKLRGILRPTTKYLLRQAMGNLLPAEVLRQPKAGFGAPVDHWLTYDLRGMMNDLLSEDRIRRRGLFKSETVRAMIDQHEAGRQDWSAQLWQLLTLELWLQAFVDRKEPVSGVSSRLGSGVPDH